MSTKIYDALYQDSEENDYFFYTGKKNVMGLTHPDNYFLWGNDGDPIGYSKIGTISFVENAETDKDIQIREIFGITLEIESWGNPSLKENYEKFYQEYPDYSFVKRFLQVSNNIQYGQVMISGLLSGDKFVKNTLVANYMPMEINTDTDKIDLSIILTYSTYKDKFGSNQPCYNIWLENKNKVLFDHESEVVYKVSTSKIYSNSINALPMNEKHSGSLYYMNYCNIDSFDLRDSDWSGETISSETVLCNSVNLFSLYNSRISNLEKEVDLRLPDTCSNIITFAQDETHSSESTNLLIESIDLMDYTEQIINKGNNGVFSVKNSTPGTYMLQLKHSSKINSKCTEYIDVYRNGVKLPFLGSENNGASNGYDYNSLPITVHIDSDDELEVKVSFTIPDSVKQLNYSANTYLLVTRQK